METDHKVVDQCNKILSALSQFTTYEKDYPFVECAIFADDGFKRGFHYQYYWHFIDIPYFTDDYRTNDTKLEPQNVIWAIGQMIDSLKLKDDGVQPNIDLRLSWSLNLRFLIHYVGDVHQPLHSMQRFSHQYPGGDKGGNDFKIQDADGKVTNLHALWDSVLTEFLYYWQGPLNETGWEFFTNKSLEFRNNHPESSFDDLDKPIEEWSKESYKIGSEFVYKEIKEHETPSKEYKQKGYAIAERQITKAGYRLARILKQTIQLQEEEMRFLQ